MSYLYNTYGPTNSTTIRDSGTNLTVGISAGNNSMSGTNNTILAHSAGGSVTSGQSLTLVGQSSGASITNSNMITAIGTSCLSSVNNSNCTGVGALCFPSATGIRLTGVGMSAGRSLTSTDDVTALGYNAFFTATGAGLSTAVGSTAGSTQTTYTNCTFLGAGADASTNSLTNATAIGYNATVSASNCLVLGNGTKVGIGISNPSNILHLVGTYQQKGITSGWTGTDIIKGQASVQTTNSTATTILTIPVATSPDTAIVARVSLVGLKTDGSAAAFGDSVAGAFYNGTTTASISTLPTFSLTTTTLFAVLASWTISGNNLLVQVTGISSTNINWVCRYEYHSVSTSTS